MMIKINATNVKAVELVPPLDEELKKLQELGLPETAVIEATIYISGDHLYNISIALSWNSAQLRAQSYDHDPVLLIKKISETLKSRLKVILANEKIKATC